MTVTKEFQSSLCIITCKRSPIFIKENKNSVLGWTTTMRFFHSIHDTDGLQRMCRKGILSTLKSSNNPKQIKVFMQVTWSLTTEEEIILKRFHIFQKEHLSYFSQTISSAPLRKSFLSSNAKLLYSVKSRKSKLRIFYWWKHLNSQPSKVYCSSTIRQWNGHLANLQT